MVIEIPYPKKKFSHDEIKAQIYIKLIELGIDAHLEVITPKLDGRAPRLDIVIFKNHKARGIIECKSWSLTYLRNRKYQKNKNSKQLTRYREHFKLPLFVCGCRASIEPAVSFATKLCYY